MDLYRYRISGALLLAASLLFFAATGAVAAIDGVTGTSFSFTAREGVIANPDGSVIPIWGYANGDQAVQYPGPTLIVNQGATVTVTLTNQLAEPVSILFPGQKVTATGGASGLLTREALPGGASQVTYTFTASHPGTFTYYSGSHSDLQVEMGLVGALIVRPAGYDPQNKATWTAYGDARSAYDTETLFLMTEMDPELHYRAGAGLPADTTGFFPTIWFYNGRAAPDTMAPAGAGWLPNQPYNCLPQAHPGERVLMRIIGGGRDSHPHHTHGNNFELIARDGRLLESAPGASALLVADAPVFGTVPDLAVSNFTQAVIPGATYDTIFTWTGQGLGWDPYGAIDSACTDADHDGKDDVHGRMCHDASCTDTNGDGFDDASKEYCADHGKPFPVRLPGQQDLTFGQFYSGGPFLGSAASLPPGQGGFNPAAGYFFMWHSHNEKELTNNDIFPGGMLTMFLVLPFGTDMP
ncbi:MAG: multicopper oxidase domain-containing protein [Desulfuromonadales bacterium]|nr:multicopper oxidase domain-containing protein [Desulfuromonadales bacterium]